ncbi:hypothetical protein ACHMW6_31440 [Pseudoduganella sp. UC29_106]|uniref:hypothetical protein n=1 Tax=Pseudoduganella sp. UC29_106 TaxID=3374553 RepID=UPI00375667AF
MVSPVTKLLRNAAFASLLAASFSLPAHAESFASSASSAGSASSGSVSDSIGGSSDSSSGKKKVAAGQYRVIDIAQAPGKAGKVRLTLRAADAGMSGEFYLDVPNRALADQPLAAGNLVDVRERAYGYEFANVQTQRPFFLALHDDWYSELRSNAL